MRVVLVSSLLLFGCVAQAGAQSWDCSAFAVASAQACVPAPQAGASSDVGKSFLFMNRCSRPVRVHAAMQASGQTVEHDVVVPGGEIVEQTCDACDRLLSWAVTCIQQ